MFENSRGFAKFNPHDILFVSDRRPGGFFSLIIDVLLRLLTTVRRTHIGFYYPPELRSIRLSSIMPRKRFRARKNV